LAPLAACAAPKPQLPVTQQQSVAPVVYPGTVVAIRPESSSQDPTGSLQQIMSILGQPAPQPLNASEVVMSMPDGTVKTSVESPTTSLTVGSKAAITANSGTGTQPY